MSDIVIRNIQIPKDNGILVLFVDRYKKVGVFENRKFARPTDAIELPPHGRLIDADALPIKDEWAVVETNTIWDAPTVLEASDENS